MVLGEAVSRDTKTLGAHAKARCTQPSLRRPTDELVEADSPSVEIGAVADAPDERRRAARTHRSPSPRRRTRGELVEVDTFAAR